VLSLKQTGSGAECTFNPGLSVRTGVGGNIGKEGVTPLTQKILKFEGSFGEILSIFPLSK
jgi:hypothetical protein